MSKIEKVPTSSFSPYWGCSIMIIILIVFGGMIGWGVYSLFSQDKVIAGFTVEQGIELPPVTLPANEEAALKSRLSEFALQVAAKQPAVLTLTVAEINALLPMAPDLGSGTYEKLIRFKGTDPEKSTLLADVSLPLNRVQFWEDKKRFLNAEAVFKVEAGDEGVDAKIIDVKVPGKEIHKGFIAGLESSPWISPYKKSEPLGTAIKAVKKVEVTPTGVTLSTQK